MLTVNACAVFVLQFVMYTGISSFLQWYFYNKGRDRTDDWKLQPPKHKIDPSVWWLPIFDWLTGYHKRGRHPWHTLLTTTNLLNSCCFSAGVTELYMRGKTKLLLLPSATELPGAAIVLPFLARYGGEAVAKATWMAVYSVAIFLIACLYQCVAEYYWHRVMHLPFFYRHLHKYHHYYTSPSPFDDMMIHPLEGTGYYIILYAPALMFPMPLHSFLAYMALMGLTGIFDHSGISIRFGVRGSAWFGYDSRDHDMHHMLYNCNYSFPFVFMDKIHGTYRSIDSVEPSLISGPDAQELMARLGKKQRRGEVTDERKLD